MRSDDERMGATRLPRRKLPQRLPGSSTEMAQRSQAAPAPPGDGAALLPMVTALSRDFVHEGPGERGTIELHEIVAVRQSDGGALVLGYGTVAEDALYLLVDGYPGGGFAAVMRWAEVTPEDGFSYDPERGLLVGPEDRPRLVVGRSGCRVRLTFASPRTGPGTDIAGVSWWGPSES